MSLIKKHPKSTLVLLFCTCVFISLIFGAVRVPLNLVRDIFLDQWFGQNFQTYTKAQNAIIYNVRLPRVIVTAIVGASLGISGAAIQSLFRNPMADPGMIGISSGASLGAVIAISTGMIQLNIYMMPLFAILGSLLSAWIIFRQASDNGKVSTLTLILSGIALSTFIRAITSLILMSLQDQQISSYLYWSLGSLSDRRWEHVYLAFFPILIGCMCIIHYSRELNVLLLGDEEAKSLGLNPDKVRRRLLLFISITTAIAVCISGSISFVGLIVPHMMRLIVGPDNDILLPVSAIGGSIFLLLCDFLSRIVIAPAEVSVGIVTALVGAPYFIYLLNRLKSEGINL